MSLMERILLIADRRNVYETYGLDIRDAMKVEWANGVNAHIKEGARPERLTLPAGYVGTAISRRSEGQRDWSDAQIPLPG